MHKEYKIGLFIDSFFPILDGVIVSIDAVAKQLCKLADVTIFTAAPPDGKYDDSNLGYKVIRCKSKKIPFAKTLYWLPKPKSDKAFKVALKESNLDLVHIHSPFPVGKMGLGYAKKNKIPVVSTLHSQFKKDFYTNTHSKIISSIMTKVIMRVFNASDECWVANKACKELLHDYGSSKEPIIMPFGTHMSPIKDKAKAKEIVNKEYKLNDTERIFLYVGRIDKLKNVFFIVEVLKVLKEKDYNFKMIFVGKGCDIQEFKKQISKYELCENVILTGSISCRDALARLYARADMFVFPSFYDTDGIVRREAACQHTPTICAEGSLIAKTVEPDHNGYTAPPNPEKFAQRIIDALGDTQKHKSISENAFNELYTSWETVAQNTFARYKALIERN